MKFHDQLNAALDGGLVKEIFDQVKNYLLCALLLAIGIVAFKEKTGLFFGHIAANAHNFSGVAIIGLSLILFCLNLLDGIRKISKYRHGGIYSTILVIVYFVVSVRVMELAWYFRTI